jgi:hypothetical protein
VGGPARFAAGRDVRLDKHRRRPDKTARRGSVSMKWPAFGYVRAGSLDEVWRLLAEHGDAARVIAGGQTLLATLAFRLSEPQLLIDITRLAALRGISEARGVLRIGALSRHAELGRDALVARHAPLLAEAVPHIAHPAIRNRGTIGGSLAYADPAAELPACIVALDATLHLVSAEGERRVSAPLSRSPPRPRPCGARSSRWRAAPATTRWRASPPRSRSRRGASRRRGWPISAWATGRCWPRAPPPRWSATLSRLTRSRPRRPLSPASSIRPPTCTGHPR